ncbi:hypothetical protein STEG23_032465, partial [Scotinomys teguina]
MVAVKSCKVLSPILTHILTPAAESPQDGLGESHYAFAVHQEGYEDFTEQLAFGSMWEDDGELAICKPQRKSPHRNWLMSPPSTLSGTLRESYP